MLSWVDMEGWVTWNIQFPIEISFLWNVHVYGSVYDKRTLDERKEISAHNYWPLGGATLQTLYWSNFVLRNTKMCVYWLDIWDFL